MSFQIWILEYAININGMVERIWTLEISVVSAKVAIKLEFDIYVLFLIAKS